MEDLTPFATIEQFEAFWRPLNDAEQTRATALLELASNRLRMAGERMSVDIDAKKAASGAYGSVLQWVVMEATKRAMLTPIDQAPINSSQRTAGPYSENIVFTNPAGDLWFKKSELQDLGLYANQRLNNVSTVPGSTMYDAYESS